MRHNFFFFNCTQSQSFWGLIQAIRYLLPADFGPDSVLPLAVLRAADEGSSFFNVELALAARGRFCEPIFVPSVSLAREGWVVVVVVEDVMLGMELLLL